MTTSMKKSESNWWWINRPYLRKLLILPLILVNREYKRWRNALLNPRKMSKRLSEIEKRFPKKREDLVGRDKEYQLIMSAIGYHVIRDQTLLNLLKGAPPPKFFILKGTTGSGKTLLAEVCIRDGIEYGINKGVNVQPIVVMGSDIFNPLYGQSVLNLSYIFRKAKDVPSIIFFDEFQSIGLRVERPMYGADREDMRIQDAFVEHINRILNSSQRTVVIAATNKFESIREDIRRRAYLIDLDQNITREMLLAVLKAELEKYGWTHLSPNEVLNVLEKAVSTYRQTQLTPFDIIDACNKVRSRKIEPLRESFFKRLAIKRFSSEDLKVLVTIDDFKMVARELRGYTEQEKSDEVMSSVLRIKPSVSYKDIGGLFGIKEKLFKIISLSLSPELASKLSWVPPKGFLLWGEPGCGKTYLSKAIAKENDAAFFYVPAAQLLINAKWVGEPEKNVRDLFALARKYAPSIIFFDEFDVIAGKRKGDPISDRLTAQILTELDGLQPLENVIVIAATNRLEMIDEAIINRFEPYVIEIPLPRNDAERLDVLKVHLRHYTAHLHPEVTPEKVLNILKKHRAISPRVVAEIIKEANRLRSQEVNVALELSKDWNRYSEIYNLYREEIERLKEILGELNYEVLKNINPENYKIRLYHFEKAAEELEGEIEKEIMDAQESMVYDKLDPGIALGLATDIQGRKGIILIVECECRPKGSGKVTVTGAAKAAFVGPGVPVEDVSVLESANNIVEYIKNYIYEKIGIDISNYDFTFQVISPLEGAPGMGVSGPSLGLAFSVAAISELAGIEGRSDVVMSGKGDIKGNVGPVGGMGWRGSGKILAAVQTRRIKIKKFVLPKWNYERAPDEMKILKDEGIEVIPVEKQLEAWLNIFSISEEELLERLYENLMINMKKVTLQK
ncbi:MAG: AAA family ATPase [Candidatus Methanomethylicaceae archaeon]|nr:AAA family ATPase [Candidatus Verstraetearchaeota archaeon]